MLKIGGLKLDGNAISAPLAGFSDASWRLIVREFGASMVFSEMISVEGLLRAQKKTKCYLKNFPAARPFCVQLFGANPESFKNAFDVLNDFEFDAVDINMGCPVKKVVSKGAGAAIMKSPKTAGAIVENVRSVYNGPLTVKLRSGWDSAKINAVEIATICEDCGADAVIIHPRTKEQSFRGTADWKIIGDVKKAVSVPVIGNGDVSDKESFEKMTTQTSCDGVMIGRAAISAPWIFGEIRGLKPPDIHGKFSLIKRHIGLLMENEDEKHAITMMKKFVPKYLKGVKNHKILVQKIHSEKSIANFLNCLELFEKTVDNGD